MNIQSLAKVAQEISVHASTPPREKGKLQAINTLSPHFTHFVEQCIRKFIITEVQKAEKGVVNELISFKAFLPEKLHGQFEQSCAVINETLHSIYK